MKVIQSILLYIFILSAVVFGQQVSNWKTLTNMSNVRAIAVSGEGIWAATSGGAFLYGSSDSGYTYKTLAKADGLEGASLTAVDVDKNGKIWFGSSRGVIDVYDPVKGSFKTILSIFNSDKTTKQINNIKAFGDTIFVSTDYGVTLFDINSLQTRDTYSRYGTFTSNIKVNSTLKTIASGNQSALLYICTNLGVAIQKPEATNLLAESSWNVYTANNGFISTKINKVVNYQGNIIAATGRGLFIFNGSSWTSYIPELNSSEIIDVSSDGSSLFILVAGNLYSYNNGVLSNIFQSPAVFTALNYSNNFGILIGTTAGILKINGNTSENLAPNGPYANLFPSLSVDQNGALWSASSSGTIGGFYKYYNGLWTNYNIASTPKINTNAYFNIYTAPDNTIYVGSWGFGFARLKEDKIDVFDVNNTSMVGINSSPEYLVITGFASDSKNNTWILNYEAADKNALAMLTPDSTWHFFINKSEDNTSLNQRFALAIDQSDTKWYASYDSRKTGLFYFNENKTYDNTDDDKSGYLNTTNGLNDNIVNTIVTDRRGDIWVGTAQGVNVISNTGSILSQKSLRVTSVFSLHQQTINCIAVDPLNQKWVGTNQGLILVNSDGSSLLASYDSKTSPLLNDVIRSIAIDENSGKIYVGTDDGLTTFETMLIKPSETFSELFLYPSPFIIRSSNNILTIDGLIRDCDVKVLSTSGKLINQFGTDIISPGSSSPGGYRAIWNGRDMDGQLVNSGIYFIVAFDKDGNNVSTGKVAVLKE